MAKSWAHLRFPLISSALRRRTAGPIHLPIKALPPRLLTLATDSSACLFHSHPPPPSSFLRRSCSNPSSPPRSLDSYLSHPSDPAPRPLSPSPVMSSSLPSSLSHKIFDYASRCHAFGPHDSSHNRVSLTASTPPLPFHLRLSHITNIIHQSTNEAT